MGREPIDDLLDGDDRSRRRQRRLLLHADDAVDEDVAVAVRLLRVDDRDVGTERAHRGERLAGERTGDGPDPRIHARQIGADVAAEHGAGQSGGARGVGVGHRGVAVLLDLERMRPAALDGVAEARQRAHAGVAAPREDQLPGAAGADQLVVEQVRRHADEREVADPLPDDLVAGGERDQMGEAFQGHAVARCHEAGDGLVETEHRATAYHCPGSSQAITARFVR